MGRSAAAKSLDEKAVHLAVVAHIRHTETNYDALLNGGSDRHSARIQVANLIDQVLDRWKKLA